jgi:hypothetical protein
MGGGRSHGRVIDSKVIRRLGVGLDEKAIEAIQNWKFRPGLKGRRAHYSGAYDRSIFPLGIRYPPRTGHLMTGCALAISIPTAGRRRTVPPEVCLRSPLTDTNRFSHFRHRPILSFHPSQTVSIPAVQPRQKSSNPHSKHSSISDAAPFKRYPNSLGDQQHGSLQPFLASGAPINAYDLPTA